MIIAAKNPGREIQSRNRFIIGDASQFRRKFDSVCILGNALSHFSTEDLSRTLPRIDTHCRGGAYFIADYRDMILLMFDRRWSIKERCVEKDRGRISLTKGCDTETGYVILRTTDLRRRNDVGFAHHIWSPFITSTVMRDHAWVLAKRRTSKRRSACFDVYRKT
jgi:hypothetical protein